MLEGRESLLINRENGRPFSLKMGKAEGSTAYFLSRSEVAPGV
jgi:hypothetical protein